MTAQTSDASEEIGLPIAAQELGISGERARRLVLSRRLPGRLVSGRWLVRRTDLDAYRVQQSEQEAVP